MELVIITLCVTWYDGSILLYLYTYMSLYV